MEKNKYNHLLGIIIFSLGVSLVMTLIRYLLGYRKIVVLDLILILIMLVIAIIENRKKVRNNKTKYMITLINIVFIFLLFLPVFENLGLLKKLIAIFTYLVTLSVFGLLYYFWNKFYIKK